MLGDDPLGTYLDAAAESRAGVAGAGRPRRGRRPSTVGDFPAKAVLNARIFDTTILSWDLATACGLQHGIDDEQAAYVLRVARALVPDRAGRQPRALPRPVGAGRGDARSSTR